MPMLLSAMWGGFLMILGSAVTQVLIAISFGSVTFVGVKIAMTFFEAGITERLGALPAELLGVMGVLGVGNAISILISAVTIRMVLAGLNASSGKIKQWGLGKGSIEM